MSNRGVDAGVTPEVWHRYKPQMKNTNGGDPTLDDAGSTQYQTAQYLLKPDGRVQVVFQTEFIGTFGAAGSGTGNWAFTLPVPAHRPSGPNTSCPMPIGTGQCYISFTGQPNVNCDVVPTIADPSSALDDPDHWFQAYAPYVLDWGTFALATNTHNNSNSHNVNWAFNPEDIEVLMPGASVSQAWWPVNVNSINASSLTVSTANSASGTGGPTNLNYKIRAEPPSGAGGALVGPNVPWNWNHWVNVTTGPFGNFFFHLEYRARR